MGTDARRRRLRPASPLGSGSGDNTRVMQEFPLLLGILIVSMVLAANAYGAGRFVGAQMRLPLRRSKAVRSETRETRMGRGLGVFLAGTVAMAICGVIVVAPDATPTTLDDALIIIAGVIGAAVAIGVWRASFAGGALSAETLAVYLSGMRGRLPFLPQPKAKFQPLGHKAAKKADKAAKIEQKNAKRQAAADAEAKFASKIKPQ